MSYQPVIWCFDLDTDIGQIWFATLGLWFHRIFQKWYKSNEESKNSKDLLENVKSTLLSKITSITALNLSTLHATIARDTFQLQGLERTIYILGWVVYISILWMDIQIVKWNIQRRILFMWLNSLSIIFLLSSGDRFSNRLLAYQWTPLVFH